MTALFEKVLVANRGEIACRIIKTLQQLAISAVAVYSDADETALHVKQADEAYHLGPSPAIDSYLNQEKLLCIAEEAKVDAIHPGYGFLSENASFAYACEKAGFIFIGPSAKNIEQMACKSTSKHIMSKHNIPILPGYHGSSQHIKHLAKKAQEIGFPLLIKPVMGGGGKGMHRVENAQELQAALYTAQREAKASFANSTLLLEKFLSNARHIEVQIFSDSHGNCVHLFERDCSIQRRHQKIIEEAQAPSLSDALRARLGKTAIDVARAIDYQGAGTVEFLLDESGEFFFMEMNTRLQVEHPVTEFITGQDLVAWQIQVASGAPLPCSQAKIRSQGHAIEARIYAEDPSFNFLPATGKIFHLQWPAAEKHLRVDSGLLEGDEITIYYDPMLAKIIAWGETRLEATKRLTRALARCELLGVKTNIPFLIHLLKEKAFLEGNYHTHWLPSLPEKNQPKVLPPPVLAGACLYELQKNLNPLSPWFSSPCWRLGLASKRLFKFNNEQNLIEVELSKTHNSSGFTLSYQGNHFFIKENFMKKDTEAMLNIEGQQHKVTILTEEQSLWINYQEDYFLLTPVRHVVAPYGTSAEGASLKAPMTGTVTAIHYAAENEIQQGNCILVLEAMKMEHHIKAPKNGKVIAIHYKVGDLVEAGSSLLDFEAS